MDNAKPFGISKREVWEAYKRVRANQGAAGVDEQSLAEFEEDLTNNLYKLWNRMASGSYFPPPVRRVEIPKDKGVRRLGIPTVSDRIAQMVVKRYLEPIVEKIFHPDSYGYRPGKSAIEAVGVARQRCWRYDWALHLDVTGCFDNIDRTLLMRAVRKHTDCPWALLYIERWLAAPVQLPDGSLLRPEKGVPQGAVVSPVLSNLFLHYAFDVWMVRYQAGVLFERYADDALCHCTSRSQADQLKVALTRRLAACGLELHPQKTRVVYCKDSLRRGHYPESQFDFLGFTFRPRKSKDRFGRYFTNFTPAVSQHAATAMRQTMRRWAVHRRTDKALDDLARMFNPVLRGWLNYYGSYYRSALHPVFRHLDDGLTRWAKQKYKGLRRHHRRARHWLQRVARRQPGLFAHWQFFQSVAGQYEPNDSRGCAMSRAEGIATTGGRSSRPMTPRRTTDLNPKGGGDNSMLVKRGGVEDVYTPALQRLSDRVKAGVPEPQCPGAEESRPSVARLHADAPETHRFLLRRWDALLVGRWLMKPFKGMSAGPTSLYTFRSDGTWDGLRPARAKVTESW